MFAVVFGKKYAKTNYQPSRCELEFKTIVIMHQLIPPASSSPPPPRGSSPGLAHLFALDGKCPGMGTFELSISPGWGQKKRANAPSSVYTATFFIDRPVE